MRTDRFSAADIEEVLSKFKAMTQAQAIGKMEAYQQLAEEYGRSVDSIRHLVLRFRPTINIAKAHLQANAFRLTARAIRNASVSEAIELLRDPAIGVVSPKREIGPGGGGFFINVNVNSLGAVQAEEAETLGKEVIEGQSVVHYTPELPPAPEIATSDDERSEAERGAQEAAPRTHPTQAKFGHRVHSTRSQEALLAARNRLHKARSERAREVARAVKL